MSALLIVGSYEEDTMKAWYIIVDRFYHDKGSLTKTPARYRKNKKRYSVFGPYNLAAARFNLFGYC